MDIYKKIKQFRELFYIYFEDRNIGQYDDNGVNIGFKKPVDLVQEWLYLTLKEFQDKHEEEIDEMLSDIDFDWLLRELDRGEVGHVLDELRRLSEKY